MTKEELYKLLNELRSLPSETEWVEFKKAGNSYDFNKLGRCFSAVRYGILRQDINFIEKPFSSEGLARKGREVLDK